MILQPDSQKCKMQNKELFNSVETERMRLGGKLFTFIQKCYKQMYFENQTIHAPGEERENVALRQADSK